MDTLTLKEVKTWNITAETNILSGSRDRKRELVRIRDNHTCQVCGRVWEEGARRFDIHHIDCDNSKTKKSDNLDNEWDNMITLCHKCHLSLPEHKQKMKISRSNCKITIRKPRVKKKKLTTDEFWAKRKEEKEKEKNIIYKKVIPFYLRNNQKP